MFIRLMALLALLLPAAALAQVAPKSTSVEILATGQFDAPATAYVLTASWSIDAGDEDGARKAQTERQTRVRAALRTAGVPDTAVTLTPGTDYTSSDMFAESNAVVVDVDGSEDTENAATVDFPTISSTSVTDTISIRATSMDQANAVRAALSGVDVHVTGVQPTIDDPDGARRRAKTMAVDNARADAMAYAKALGLRIVRVVRISETGNGLFLPSFQNKFQDLMTMGPRAMEAAFKEAKPGFVHVEATIIVEFEMAP